MSLIDRIRNEHQKVGSAADPLQSHSFIVRQLRKRRAFGHPAAAVSGTVWEIPSALSFEAPINPEIQGIEVPDPSKFSAGMGAAYAASSYMMKAKMRKEDPRRFGLLNKVTKGDVIVVKGSMDHLEEVFDASVTPYTLVDAWQLNGGLKSDQVVFVNCPGTMDSRYGEELKRFVEKGGFLVTTDWALKNVVQAYFPGIVQYSGGSTRDDCVPIEAVLPENPYTKGVIDRGVKPVWWLEGGSYPIKITDKKRAHLLFQSAELGKKYGEMPVGIYFDHKKGRVFHFISHFYLQRTEGRGTKSSQPIKGFVQDSLDLTDDEVSAVQSQLGSVSVSEAESAYTSARLIHNIIIDKMARSYR